MGCKLVPSSIQSNDRPTPSPLPSTHGPAPSSVPSNDRPTPSTDGPVFTMIPQMTTDRQGRIRIPSSKLSSWHVHYNLL